MFWPAKPRASDRPVIFQLHFWDCGDGALKKFEHLLPVSRGRGGGGHTGTGPPRNGCFPTPPQACKEEADAILFLFSFTDRSSFEELLAQMSRIVGPGEENLVKVVVGTKYPSWGASSGGPHPPRSGLQPCVSHRLASQ